MSGGVQLLDINLRPVFGSTRCIMCGASDLTAARTRRVQFASHGGGPELFKLDLPSYTFLPTASKGRTVPKFGIVPVAQSGTGPPHWCFGRFEFCSRPGCQVVFKTTNFNSIAQYSEAELEESGVPFDAAGAFSTSFFLCREKTNSMSVYVDAMRMSTLVNKDAEALNLEFDKRHRNYRERVLRLMAQRAGGGVGSGFPSVGTKEACGFLSPSQGNEAASLAA